MNEKQTWRVASADSRQELEELLNTLDAKGYDAAFVFSEGQSEGFDFTVVAKVRADAQRGLRRSR